MADGTTGAPQTDRVREIEMRLWEEVGTQLKGVTDAMKDLTHEMRDVRERLIRMEAQDQPAKIAKLEADLREANDEIAQVKHDTNHEIAQVKHDTNHEIASVKQAVNAEIAAVKQAANTDIAAVKQTASDDKLALEKRLTRMEVIIAPLTVGGSALLAALIGAIVTAMSGGLGH